MQKLFDFALKIDHALARDRQTILADIKPQKEDAYFAFTLASAVLNVITRKTNRNDCGVWIKWPVGDSCVERGSDMMPVGRR